MGTMLSPNPPCSTHGSRAPGQQLGSRSLVFKSIKGDCYGDTAAASTSGSARHPRWPSPPTHLPASRPSKFGVCLEFMDALTVFSREIGGSGEFLQCLRRRLGVTQPVPAGTQPSQGSTHALSSAEEASTGLSPASKQESFCEGFYPCL